MADFACLILLNTGHALQGRETAAEKRYRKLLLSGLELNKDFYFSYTYNLARTLQANLTADAPADPFDSMFVWNEYLSRYVGLKSAVRNASICRICMHAVCSNTSHECVHAVSCCFSSCHYCCMWTGMSSDKNLLICADPCTQSCINQQTRLTVGSL